MTISVLAAVMGCAESRAKQFIESTVEAMRVADISTPLRQAHFLSQVGHECGGLRYMEELATGQAYEGRADLGNTQPGDGPRFKGRGLIQLTGRRNYGQFLEWCKAMKMDPPDFLLDPVQVARLPWSTLAAAFYWSDRKLNRLADRDDIEALTRAINGGLNGIDDRRRRLAIAKKKLLK